MDAIKKHRFWILLGLAVPMILYGYIAANASLREATTKREAEIKDVEGKIPPSSKPNGRFAEGLKAVNDKHKAQVDAALGSLWGEQAKMMVWPSIVANRVPKKYYGEIALQPRFAYKNEYPTLWEKLFYSLEPMVPETIRGTTHTQKVFVEPSALTVSVFVPNQAPSSEEVWDAQEDLWLMQMLADAIRTANKYADGPANATVRSIEAFKLLGGSGTAVPKAVMGAPGSSGGGADALFTAPMGPMTSGPTIASGGALINPAEEFGSDVDGAASGGDMMSSAASMPMSGGPAAIKRIRYIGATDKEFKERGFYLRVVISQMKIPEFLTTLTNCPWPVRIVRFNMSPNPHEKPFTPGGSMGPESYPMANSGFEGAGAFGANPFGGAGGAYPEGGSPGGFDPSGYGGGGGISNILAADAAGAANIIPGFVKVPDKFGALQHPDLIQLDVLGAITLYNPPATDPAATGEAAPMGTTPMEGTPPADPMAATTPAAEPMSTPAAEPATPAEGAPAPAATDPAKPTDGEKPADPAKPSEGAPAAPADPAAPDAKPAAPPADAPPADPATPPAAGENPGTPAAAPPSK